MTDDELREGTLFGVDVTFDLDMIPGAIEVHGGEVPERPPGWTLMDNATRFAWLASQPGLTFLVGEGSTEAMFTSQGFLA